MPGKRNRSNRHSVDALYGDTAADDPAEDAAGADGEGDRKDDDDGEDAAMRHGLIRPAEVLSVRMDVVTFVFQIKPVVVIVGPAVVELLNGATRLFVGNNKTIGISDDRGGVVSGGHGYSSCCRAGVVEWNRNFRIVRP